MSAPDDLAFANPLHEKSPSRTGYGNGVAPDYSCDVAVTPT
jgi:hypothetical protein